MQTVHYSVRTVQLLIILIIKIQTLVLVVERRILFQNATCALTMGLLMLLCVYLAFLLTAVVIALHALVITLTIHQVNASIAPSFLRQIYVSVRTILYPVRIVWHASQPLLQFFARYAQTIHSITTIASIVTTSPTPPYANSVMDFTTMEYHANHALQQATNPNVLTVRVINGLGSAVFPVLLLRMLAIVQNV